jgi:hypothetical protein
MVEKLLNNDKMTRTVKGMWVDKSKAIDIRKKDITC